MLRVEVYSLLNGFQVRVIGACSVQGHLESECPGESVGTRVYDDEVAVKGMRMAVYDAIGALLWQYPEVTQYVDH